MTLPLSAGCESSFTLAILGSMRLQRGIAGRALLIPVGALVFVSFAPVWRFTTGGLENGLTYTWLPGLGGLRRGRRDSPHVGWTNPSFRAYADHLETTEFATALAELLELASRRPTTILCAEAVPWRCHRQLIADALLARGVEVQHVVGHGAPTPHRLTAFARRVGERLVYNSGQLI